VDWLARTLVKLGVVAIAARIRKLRRRQPPGRHERPDHHQHNDDDD